MSVSDLKLAANRKNAKHSTGPKTREGKSRSRCNALKHGLLAQEVLLPWEGREEAEQLKHLVASLVHYYAPQGPVEEILVETIATLYWRKRRALRAEGGAIQAGLQRV